MHPRQILECAHSILVIDWPSKDVPESLARAGFHVIAKGGPGPEDYSAYEVDPSGKVVESSAVRAARQIASIWSTLTARSLNFRELLSRRKVCKPGRSGRNRAYLFLGLATPRVVGCPKTNSSELRI